MFQTEDSTRKKMKTAQTRAFSHPNLIIVRKWKSLKIGTSQVSQVQGVGLMSWVNTKPLISLAPSARFYDQLC